MFARDTLTGATTLVSRAAGPDGAVANGGSGSAAVSADGTKVAFFSTATNLIGGVPADEIYERDLSTGAITLVSRADGTAGAAATLVVNTGTLALNADGSKVLFSATDDHLVPIDNNHHIDVFVRDVNAGTTTLASTTTTGTSLNNNAFIGSLSSDGTRVAFLTNATNVGDGVTDIQNHVHVRDLLAGTTTLVDRATGAAGVPETGSSFSAQLSADGTRVVFASLNPLTPDAGAATNQVYVRDLTAATTTLASRADGAAGAPNGQALGPGSPLPQISYDGTTVSFEALGGLQIQAFERNLAAGSTTLIGAIDGAPTTVGDGQSVNGSLDVDGSCAVFSSSADNLISPSYGTRDFAQVYGHVLSRECPLVAPDTLLDSGPAATITVPTASFAYHATEGGSTFTCQLDGGAFTPCGATFMTPPLANGVHRFAVAATDPAGNTDATPALADFTVAVVPPDKTKPALSAVSMTHTTFKDSSTTTATQREGGQVTSTSPSPRPRPARRSSTRSRRPPRCGSRSTRSPRGGARPRSRARRACWPPTSCASTGRARG